MSFREIADMYQEMVDDFVKYSTDNNIFNLVDCEHLLYIYYLKVLKECRNIQNMNAEKNKFVQEINDRIYKLLDSDASELLGDICKIQIYLNKYNVE